MCVCVFVCSFLKITGDGALQVLHPEPEAGSAVGSSAGGLCWPVCGVWIYRCCFPYEHNA